MDIVFFVIFVSLLTVTALILFAFFPIRVSWFYYREKASPHGAPATRQSVRGRKHNYKAASPHTDDSFDDPEL